MANSEEGVKTLKEGEMVLAQTRRPDGIIRKQIRIRAGYTPQDEVPIYQSKGALGKNSESVEADERSTGEVTASEAVESVACQMNKLNVSADAPDLTLNSEALFSSKPPNHFLPHTKPSTFLTVSGMENSPPPSLSPSILVLGGKSSQENEIGKSLKDKFKTLTLPVEDSEVSVYLYDSDAEKKTYEGEEEAFKIETYMNSLSANRFGRFLIWSPRLSSTQDLIAKNFCELPIGAVCVADIQFKGRGRSSNIWESPAGCLLFSFTLQMDDGRIVPLLQYVVSLAVVEALKDVCDAKVSTYVGGTGRY